MILGDMAIVILATILGLLIALIGIEMVNTPPTKQSHRWFWRISFMAIGLGVVVLACMQYKGDEEKSKRIYDSFAKVISNEAAIKDSVDEGKTNVAYAVGIPEFELYLNDLKMTNGESFSIKKTRKFALKVTNVSMVTADQLSVDFICPIELADTNVIADGWLEQPQSVNFINGQFADAPILNHWRWMADKSLAGSYNGKVDGNFDYYNCAAIEISTNFSLPIVPVAFEVYANRAKARRYVVYLDF
jgi:hypothetical protein